MKKSKNLTYLTQKKKSDFWLLLLTFAFTFFGILMIFEASNVAAFVSFNDKFHFVKDQFLWAVLGFILLIIFSKIHYRKLFVMAVPMLTVTIIALIAVLIPGIGIKALGARRWINLSFFSFQPAVRVYLGGINPSFPRRNSKRKVGFIIDKFV